MKYIEAVKKSMEMLAEKENAIFVGYNVCYGSAYETLKDIPLSQKLETPVAENLMAGLAMGMALEGFRPVLFFERHDFVLNAIDCIVNNIDKIEHISDGQYNASVIIKAVVGGKKPFYAGITHTQDFTSVFRELLNFSIYDPKTPSEVIRDYEQARLAKTPVMVVERKELFDKE